MTDSEQTDDSMGFIQSFFQPLKALPVKQIAWQCVVICLVSCVAGLGKNLVIEPKLPWIAKRPVFKYVEPQVQEPAGKASSADTDPSEGTAQEVYEAVTPEVAFDLFVKNQAVFVDAREKEEFNEEHITNALSLPVEDAEQGLLGDLMSVPPDSVIVVYCDEEDCDTSKDLASLLKEYGYTRVYVFQGGWEKWKDAGYPTDPAVGAMEGGPHE